MRRREARNPRGKGGGGEAAEPDGELVERAMALVVGKLGAPYVWATAGPETFDCSGFTHWVASRVLGPQDHELRSSHHQFNVWSEAVAAPGRGDLVFFDTMGVTVMGNRASHVGFALGDGRFIHAANEALGAPIDGLGSEWYRGRYIGVRRVLGGDGRTARRPGRGGRMSRRNPTVAAVAARTGLLRLGFLAPIDA